MEATTLTVAVCLCTDVTLSDFVTPMEILGTLNYPALERPIKIKIEHLSSTLDPVVGVLQRSSPQIVPTLTYDAALAAGKQFDVIWVPAGPNPKGNGHEERGVDVLPPSLINFLRWQAPTAQYVMSVCGGSYILAHAGLLSAKRATSNKYIFTHVIDNTPSDIKWVRRARWVVDGKTWTSSGVAAGSDMALAFVAHLSNEATADFIAGMMEITRAKESDDPFAAVHGLL